MLAKTDDNKAGRAQVQDKNQAIGVGKESDRRVWPHSRPGIAAFFHITQWKHAEQGKTLLLCE
jgi:hypothetical protein